MGSAMRAELSAIRARIATSPRPEHRLILLADGGAVTGELTASPSFRLGRSSAGRRDPRRRPLTARDHWPGHQNCQATHRTGNHTRRTTQDRHQRLTITV
jgi:hypothetical protein